MLTKICTPDLGGYDDEFNATVDKSKMGELPADDRYLTYAGGDTDAAQQVSDVLTEQLTDDAPLTRFYVTILHPGARAFEKLERRGVCVDVEEFAALRKDLVEVIAEGQKKTLSLLPNKMKIKFRDRIDEQLAEGKNPMLPSILNEFFFTPNGLNLKPKMLTKVEKKPALSKAHLRMFADVPEAKAMVEGLTDIDVASKHVSTFIDGFLEHLRPDGRLHPTYMLFHGGMYDDEEDESGSTTGRTSAKHPAIQLIPKKTRWTKRIRKCFTAPPGKVVVVLDYIQGELKVVACIANEKNMISAYEKGMDLHAVTGARLAKMSYEEFQAIKDLKDEPWIGAPADADTKTLAGKFKYMRDRAKPANFGLLYGMGASGLQAYAWAQYNLKLTLEEAEIMRNTFFELYWGLTDYHEAQRKLVRLEQEVRSPLGRLRHLPTIKSWDQEIRATAERQAINAPTQSTLTDMMIWAMARIEDAYPNGEFEIAAMIHDAMITYVDADKVQLRCQQAADIMSNLPFHEVGWQPQLKFTAEAEAGMNLAALSPIHLAA